MALCSQLDLEVLRQIDVTAEPDPTVEATIRLAEGILEGESARRFDPVTDLVALVQDLQTVDHSLYLPHFPITALEITDPELGVLVAGTHYHLEPKGRVVRLGLGTGVLAWDWQYHLPPHPTGWRIDTSVKYSGGIDDPADAPRDLRSLCAQMAARVWDEAVISAEGGAGIQAETIGAWSVSYKAMGLDLTPQQKRTLNHYTHKMPVVAF